jgi:tetratricopeptide (TPR) repeat protein
LTAFDFQFYSTVADHYVYVAMLGPALVAAWAVSRWRGRAVKVCAVAILVGLGVRSHVRTYDWRDTETLFAATLRVNPRSLPANLNMGMKYTEQAIRAKTPEEAKALNAEALAWYNRMLAYDATDYHAHTNIGHIYQREGRYAEAAEHYRIAMENDPEKGGGLHMMLGEMLMRQGRWEEAAGVYRQVMELPEDEDKLNRGVAREKLAEIERLQRGAASSPASVAPGTRP